MSVTVVTLAASLAGAPVLDGRPQLESQEVIVTAQRRTERAETVPVAVSAIDGRVLERLPIRDIQDLQRYVPELQTSQISRDDTIVTLRGQGPGVGAFPGVVTYMNEVPFRGLGEGFYYDLQSIQVLKGPQGTLFGRNANGGALLFTSAAPSGKLGGYAQAEIGSYANRQIQGAINLPLDGESLALRIAGIRAVRNGYTRLATGGRVDDRDVYGGRVSIRWRPNAMFGNDIIADFTNVDTNGTSAILLGLKPDGPIALLPSQLSQAALGLLAQQQRAGARVQAGASADLARHSKQWGISNRTEFALSAGATLVNIAAYRRYSLLFRSDYDGTQLPLLDYSVTPDGWVTNDEQISEELQLKSDVGKLRYTIGAYLQHNRPVDNARQLGIIYFQPILQVSEANDLSRAAYGQLDYDASTMLQGLRLSAGLRYTWDRRSQRAATINQMTGNCSGFGALPPDCLLEDTVRFKAPTWSITAAWSIKPETLVYITSRRGYKSGGLNLGQPFSTARSYQPEYITDIELGTKTRRHIGAAILQLEADIYRGDYKDVQVNALVADTTAIYNIVQNGASATIQGLELSGVITLPHSVRLAANYAYTDAVYDRYISSIYGDLSNMPWPYTARHRATVSASWQIPVPERLGQPTFGASLNLQSHSTFGYDPDPFTREPGRALLDLSLDWQRMAGSPIDLGLFVSNVTNKLYRTGVIGLYNTLGLSSAVYGAPRMFGVRLRVAAFEGRADD